MADARHDVAAKSAALRTLHRRVKDLWKFLGCGASVEAAAAVAAATSTGGHWPPDRSENVLSLSLLLRIRNTLLKDTGRGVLTQFSDTVRRRRAISTETRLTRGRWRSR